MSIDDRDAGRASGLRRPPPVPGLTVVVTQRGRARDRPRQRPRAPLPRPARPGQRDWAEAAAESTSSPGRLLRRRRRAADPPAGPGRALRRAVGRRDDRRCRYCMAQDRASAWVAHCCGGDVPDASCRSPAGSSSTARTSAALDRTSRSSAPASAPAPACSARGSRHRSAPLAAALAVGAGTARHRRAAPRRARRHRRCDRRRGRRERALEIMRDPPIGAFGATADRLDLRSRCSPVELSRRTGDGDGGRADAIRAGVAAGALSRAVPVVLAAALPYARADGERARR